MPQEPAQFRFTSGLPFFSKKWGVLLLASLFFHIFLIAAAVKFLGLPSSTQNPPLPRVINAELLTPQAKRQNSTEQPIKTEQTQNPSNLPASSSAGQRSASQKEQSDGNNKPTSSQQQTTVASVQRDEQPSNHSTQVTQTSTADKDTTAIEPNALDNLKPVDSITPQADSAEENTPKPSLATPKPSSPKASYKGQDIEFSDPIEQTYYQTLMAHLQSNISSHPSGATGEVRVQIKIQFKSVITSVKIVQSSGNPALDNWVRSAMLNLSPVPPVPESLTQPYYFRPTLVLTN